MFVTSSRISGSTHTYKILYGGTLQPEFFGHYFLSGIKPYRLYAVRLKWCCYKKYTKIVYSLILKY